jgi:hypothetical protein
LRERIAHISSLRIISAMNPVKNAAGERGDGRRVQAGRRPRDLVVC